VLFDGGNPYRGGPPDNLRLTWEDFDSGISPTNEAAMDREAEWTIVGYFAADNDLAPLIFDNLVAMKSAGSNEAVNVCVLFDGPLVTDAFFARLNAAEPLASDIVLRWPELPTNEPKTLSFALQLAATFPAKRRLVILGGHGNGWRGALLDQNGGAALIAAGRVAFPGNSAECTARWQAAHRVVQDCTDAHFAKGWAQAHAAPNKRFDILAFDACYMGNFEGLATFADQADTLVVSEDLQPGEGYPYAEVIRSVHGNPEQSADALAQYLVNATKLYYGDAARRRNVTQVALRTKAVRPLIASFLDLAAHLDVSNEAAFEALATALEQAWPYEATGSVDMIGFVMKLLAHPDGGVRASAQAILERWSAAIAAQAVRGGEDYANGLAIYAPPAGKFDPSYVTLAHQIGLDAWADFLVRYHARRAEVNLQAP
jgi:hypothetical protein